MNNLPIIMEEGFWRNTQLSIAARYGGAMLNGKAFYIVNKHGITIAELSDPDSKHYVGDGMAIEPGEPADLCREDWIPVYQKLGRERTLELVKNNVPLKKALKESIKKD